MPPQLNDMSQSDNPEQPPTTGAQRDSQVRPSSSALIEGVWLPPDMLETWCEHVLAVVAIALVAWTLIDIVVGSTLAPLRRNMASCNRLCGTLRTALGHRCLCSAFSNDWPFFIGLW
jgi:hypothetical protein